MTDLRHDGMYRVYWVDTIADTSAPTVTEVTAGVKLQCRLTPGGLQRNVSPNLIDNSKLCSTFTTQIAGRRTYDLQITFVREEGDATGVEAALVNDAEGFLVITDDTDSDTALAADDKAEVYPAQVAAVQKAPPAANELQTINVTFANTAEPVLDAVLVAAA